MLAGMGIVYHTQSILYTLSHIYNSTPWNARLGPMRPTACQLSPVLVAHTCGQQVGLQCAFSILNSHLELREHGNEIWETASMGS